MEGLEIRDIAPGDNPAVRDLIYTTLAEFSVPEEGTARADSAIGEMYQVYAPERSFYLVVYDSNTLVGGAGIAPLKEGPEGVCELQKMYLSPGVRGKGIGKKLLQICLDRAAGLGYRGCYLETMHNMTTAQALYGRFGFEPLEEPMGNTGHYACPVRMYKNLADAAS